MSSAAGNASDTVPAFAMGSYFATAVCPTWLPTNHILFQLANIFLFLSYMAPAGLYGLLYLRMCLTVGSFFFALWGYVILCAFDTMVWNAFFTAINLVHVCVLMYVLRPVRLAPHMEVVYRELFQPLKVSRQQFQAAASCVKVLKDVEPHETYAVEHVTRADSLTLLLSGRFLVSHKGRPLQIVDRFEFLDSPEWFGVCGTGGDKFQVTMTAMDRCRVVVWNRDKLKLTISGDTFLQAVFDNVVGKDVVRKLLFVTESTQNHPHAENASETTKLLIQMKENAVRKASHGEKGETLRVAHCTVVTPSPQLIKNFWSTGVLRMFEQLWQKNEFK